MSCTVLFVGLSGSVIGFVKLYNPVAFRSQVGLSCAGYGVIQPYQGIKSSAHIAFVTIYFNSPRLSIKVAMDIFFITMTPKLDFYILEERIILHFIHVNQVK